MHRLLAGALLLAAQFSFSLAAAQVVVAVPDSGSAHPGALAKPIVNVAANDTVNGAQATVGTSGNAKVAQLGTWPTGIALVPTTGAVLSSATIAPGVYSFQYQLCDKAVPTDCASATDTVTIIGIVANAVSGNAVAGASSTPIANVAANDTVNGAAAILGSSGNATVAQTGTWVAGIALNTATGAVASNGLTPPGVYALQYQLCDLLAPPDCATAAGTVTVAASILPVADTGNALAGTTSTPIANVAANDTVNGAPAALGASGNAAVSQSGSWPGGIALNPSSGAVTVGAAVAFGVYNLQYQLCDVYTPPDCANGSVTINVVAVAANADSGGAPAGTFSTPIVNVAANDTINGVPATLGSGGNAVIAQTGSWPNGMALNASSGAVTTTPVVAPGVYSVQYQLCDLNSPPDCATATDTVVINVAIVANPDSGSSVAGLAATPIANVAANDTINGAAATLGSSGNATVAAIGTWAAGISLNPSSGAVSTTSAVALGTYSLQYQLCDLNSPPDCSATTDTLNVTTATIVANPDSGTADAGIGSQPITNVAANDLVNGAPATLGSSGNATVAKIGTWTTGITLNPANGAVSTSSALATGVYSPQYQLCDLNSPPDCATGNITVTVVDAGIVANPDSGTADFGIASQPIANVAANDTINGAQAVLGSGGNAKIAKLGTWPTGLGLSGAGAVSTSAALAVGVYATQYQLCDLNTPANCATGNVTVNVIASSIVANPESGTTDAGIASTAIANVAANDTINGSPAILGTSGNAKITKSGTWQTGINLSGAGTVTTTAAVAAGVYATPYKLCDLNVPANCATANDTVTVINSSIVANPDSGSADGGIGSQPIANVTANDLINGAPVVLGAAGNATIAKSGTWNAGITLNPATGTVSTSSSLAIGVYAVQYQLCDLNVPANCGLGNITINVISSSIVANPDAGTADSGIASQPVANVAANDTVHGVPAVLGAGGNAQIVKLGTWTNGLGLNPATGAVSTQISSANGVWPVQYQLCDLNVPANCTTGNVTVTIITASILANPANGTASAGTASTPIGNVLTPADGIVDTVNGAPATLGSGGNAQVGMVGSWPTGIVLNSQSGAITVSKAVAAGTYDFQYLLCDLNVPANCAAGDVEIDVTSSVIANPDSGTAIAGKSQTPIHNVASNDTINGVQARLQTSPNATVAPVGTWAAGIALNTTTGAVTTTAAVLPGSYDISYKLCALSGSPCATAADTLIVEAALVVVPTAGSAVVGTATTAIANVAANDIVNGVAATLGASGNAVVSPLGGWPSGIALNAGTGAVTTTAAVLAGNYPLQYQLCDKNTPPDCASAAVNITVTQPFTEVLVSEYMTGDIEFDWARDGLFCPSCNFGSGNAQVNWTDRNNNLWVSGVNSNTGMFTPVSGRGNGNPVDTTAFFWQDWGNGPEWAFSTPPGSTLPISQLVYTRFAPGQPATWEYAGAAIATQTDGAPTWSLNFLPGAYTPITDNTVLPEASQCTSDPISYTVFENLYATTQMFTEPVSVAPGTAPTLTPFGAFANGIGERFVPCAHDSNSPVGGTRWLTFQGDVTIGTNTLQQVFWYDLDTQVVQQLTFDPTTKQRAVMFKAPDVGFLDKSGNPQYVLMTLAADMEIQVYLQNGWLSNGAPNMQLVNTIYSPDPVEPYMFDPKAFIHCSADYPLCRTYVVVGMSMVPNSQQTESQPNGLAVTALDPTNPMFKVLVTAQSLPATQRLDPKYFISANGPALYYDQLLALTKTQPYQDNGIFMINLQLGAPSGPCVGSSAQEGLNSTWPNCTVPPH